MADEVKKTVKAEMPDEKTAKEAAKATLLAMTGKEQKEKTMVVKAPSQVQAAPKAESKAVQAAAKPSEPKVKTEAPKVDDKVVKETPKTAPVEAKAEASKAEAKKEADPGKEFVDGIMTEMSLKGASKKRLIKMLAEQYGFDKQKVLFRLRRALITERYAAVHEASASGH